MLYSTSGIIENFDSGAFIALRLFIALNKGEECNIKKIKM